MNAAHLITTATFALATGSAFAFDDVQHYPTPSTETRAEVQAEIGTDSRVRQLGEATVFVEQDREAARSRAEVSREARQAARQDRFDSSYVGA